MNKLEGTKCPICSKDIVKDKLFRVCITVGDVAYDKQCCPECAVTILQSILDRSMLSTKTFTRELTEEALLCDTQEEVWEKLPTEFFEGRSLSDQGINYIRKLYINGVPVKTIAKMFNLSVVTIYNKLRYR